MQLEHGKVPGEMAMKPRVAVVALEPFLEEGRPRLCVQRLEGDVGEVVGGVGVGRILLERAFGEPSRLLEAVDLVVGEPKGRLIPPVVAVNGGEALHEGYPAGLSVGPAR